jgi:hypothetical protein
VPYNRLEKGKATQLRFYPARWVEVLNIAKNNWRLHISTGQPFPDREQHLNIAAECLTEAMNDYQDNDATQLEAGMFLFIICSLLTLWF